MILGEIEKLDSSQHYSTDIFYWKGWTAIFEDDWIKAKDFFNKTGKNSDLIELCTRVEDEKYSVTFAKVISYILPGSGQFYTGHWLSGIMSLGWNALFGYLSLNAFLEDRAFDGIMLTGLLWMRFYRGNIQNAEEFAVEENLKISNKALSFLQKQYQGIKP